MTAFPLEARIEKYASWVGPCLVWHGHRDKDGYPVTCIKLPGDVKAKNRRVHRLVVEGRDGALAGDLVVMHTCDNPSCINPDHLRVGTHADNIRDRDQKGRGNFSRDVRGRKNPRAKLTGFDVEDIRRRHVRGVRNGPNSTKALAEEYGVDRSQIQRIVRGDHWL